MRTDWMTPISDVETAEDDPENVTEFAEMARAFLMAEDGSRQIRTGYLGFGCSGVIGIFLFEIESAESPSA